MYRKSVADSQVSRTGHKEVLHAKWNLHRSHFSATCVAICSFQATIQPGYLGHWQWQHFETMPGATGRGRKFLPPGFPGGGSCDSAAWLESKCLKH